jgi:putative phosphoesterase
MVRVAVLADTHLRSGDPATWPVAMCAELASCDLILHAGDVLTGEVLDSLATYAPVHAVLGNNDHTLVDVLPVRLELTIGGVDVAMVHDSGVRKGRARRLRRWFPSADLVVFGHSHEPVDEIGEEGQRLFNPGSPTQRRRQPNRTLGRLTLEGGTVDDHQIVVVDDEATR